MAAKVVKGIAYEGKEIYLLARVVGKGGQPITQADIASISYDAWKIPVPLDERVSNWKDKFIQSDAPEFVIGSDDVAVPPTVEDCIFDTLQTDDRWSVDDEGYNMAIQVPESALPAIDVSAYPKSQWQSFPVVLEPVDTTWGNIPIDFDVEVKQFLKGKGGP